MTRPANPANDGRITTSFRIPVELRDALDQVCEDRLIGRNLLVTRLLMDGLQRLGQEEAS